MTGTDQQAAASYDDWKNLEERAAALAASRDPVVHGFGEFLRRDAVERGLAGGLQVEAHALAQQREPLDLRLLRT